MLQNVIIFVREKEIGTLNSEREREREREGEGGGSYYKTVRTRLSPFSSKNQDLSNKTKFCWLVGRLYIIML